MEVQSSNGTNGGGGGNGGGGNPVVRLLVAEDHPSLARSMAEGLREEGYEPITSTLWG